MGKIEKDKAEITIRYRKSEGPATLKMFREDGKWMVAPGGQRLPEFSFYISPINRPSLHMGAKTLDLTNLIDSGDIVVVAVRLYPFLLMRLGHNSF